MTFYIIIVALMIVLLLMTPKPFRSGIAMIYTILITFILLVESVR